MASDGWNRPGPNTSEVKRMTPSDKMDFELRVKWHMTVQTADTITVISENSWFLRDILKTSCV